MANVNVLRGGNSWKNRSFIFLCDGLVCYVVYQKPEGIRGSVFVVPSVLYGMWRQEQLTPLFRKSCWVFLAVGVDCYMHTAAPWRALQHNTVDAARVLAVGVFMVGLAIDAVCWCWCNDNRNVQLPAMDAGRLNMRQSDVGKLLSMKLERTQREINESDTWFIQGMRHAVTSAHHTAMLYRRLQAMEEFSGITGALLRANAEAGLRIPDNVLGSAKHNLVRKYIATGSAGLALPLKAAAAKICISKLCIAGSPELEAVSERDTCRTVAMTARELCRDALGTIQRKKQWLLVVTLLKKQKNEREAVERDRVERQGKLVAAEMRAGNEGVITGSLRDKIERVRRATTASAEKIRADCESSERRAGRILVAAGRRKKKSVPDLRKRNAELEGRRKDVENKAFRADRELERKEKQLKDGLQAAERRKREGNHRRMQNGQDQPRSKGAVPFGARRGLGRPPSGRQHAATSARQGAVHPVAGGTPSPPVVPGGQQRAQPSNQARCGGRGGGGGGGGGGFPNPPRGITPPAIGVRTPQVGLPVHTLPNRNHERAGKRGKGGTEASPVGANAAPSPWLGKGGQRLQVAPADRSGAVMLRSSWVSSRVHVACPPQSASTMRGDAAVSTQASQGFHDVAASVSAAEQLGRPPPGFESAAPGNAHACCQSTEGAAATWSSVALARPAYPPPGSTTSGPGTAGGKLGGGPVAETYSTGGRTGPSRFPPGLGAEAAPGGGGHGGGGKGGNGNAGADGLVAAGPRAGGRAVVATVPVAAHGNMGNERGNVHGANGAEQALVVVENGNGGKSAEQDLAVVEDEDEDPDGGCVVCTTAEPYVSGKGLFVHVARR